MSTGEFKLYQCNNNLWDSATPVIVGGHHLANLFVGQFLFDDQPFDRELFRKQAEKYGFDMEAYLAALDGAPVGAMISSTNVMKFFHPSCRLIAELSK